MSSFDMPVCLSSLTIFRVENGLKFLHFFHMETNKANWACQKKDDENGV